MAENRLSPRSDSPTWIDVLRAVAARKRREETEDQRAGSLARQG
ncbi:MAG TPA: hypothetical protein VIX41_04965 [Acidimicrobiales bacterium]